MTEFEERNTRKIREIAGDPEMQKISKDWMIKSLPHEYSYHFSWLGRPIIQYPGDIVALQEIIWSLKPDLIIETGIAHGGSLIFSASMLQLIGKGKVIGIDIDIRNHNRVEIEKHPLATRIEMIEGSSIDPEISRRVHEKAESAETVLVILDSNHTHSHVLEELLLYSDLVKKGSYLLVFDTVVEEMPEDSFPDRPWGKGNNPMTAVCEFLEMNSRFEIDYLISDKLLLTVAPKGYLKCVK